MSMCPCSSGKNYEVCCEIFISGKQFPPTPETLMRSRYTAYTKANVDYIALTMSGPAAFNFDKEQTAAFAKKIQWKRLKVIKSNQEATYGTVEFLANYLIDNKPDFIYEISEFKLIDNRWFYVDGKSPKIGRNENCPCGSQKKFKKCCGM